MTPITLQIFIVHECNCRAGSIFNTQLQVQSPDVRVHCAKTQSEVVAGFLHGLSLGEQLQHLLLTQRQVQAFPRWVAVNSHLASTFTKLFNGCGRFHSQLSQPSPGLPAAGQDRDHCRHRGGISFYFHGFMIQVVVGFQAVQGLDWLKATAGRLCRMGQDNCLSGNWNSSACSHL
jgi:hypothetical protein